MTVKKAAASKKVAPAEKVPPAEKVAPAVKPRPSAAKTWTLPVAMVMVTVSAMGLWIAMRESASRTQAATPDATAAVMMASDSAKTSPKPASAPSAPKAMSASGPEAAKPAEGKTVEMKPVSLTGCLQRTDRGFLLKDTEGADAPKSRSWKSGFLKRSTSSVVLKDPASSARLPDHVGRRVSVTGPLTEREMRVTSLRRVAASCD